MVTGTCLCGGVHFRIDAKLQPIQICHCSQCRKAQGTPIVTNTPVLRSAFTLERGHELLTEYESSPGKKRCFCKVCGSPIYSYRHDLPDVVRIRAGLLDQALDVTLAAHFHTASKCNWWPVTDDLPKYADGQTLVSGK